MALASALHSLRDGTLGTHKFRDTISMRYGDAPPDLPVRCAGCNATFTLQHALACKKGGLVIFYHNKIRDELVNMTGKALTHTV
jgi:hypothetical protein